VAHDEWNVMSTPKPTGYVRTIQRKGGAVFYAKLKLPDGSQPQRRLGKVWTKRIRPPEGYLTRGMAEARLAAILAGDDPLVNIAPSHVTFAQACAEHLRYLEHDRQRKRSTVGDARSTISVHLLPAFGESTPVEDITLVDVEQLRERLLAGRSHRTAQKTMILLHGILARAKRKHWIDTNPAEDVEKVTVCRVDEFNVLAVEDVHAAARAAATPLLGSLFTVAAFTGLRQGELIALRWRHVDFASRILHVQRNFVRGQEDTPKSHRVRSVPLSDQALVALDALSRREHFTGPDDLVFASVVGGHLLDDDVRDAFYAALDAAGLGHLRGKDDPIVFHDLRHTFGTLRDPRRPGDGRSALDGPRGYPDHDALRALRAAARQCREAHGSFRRKRAPGRAPNRGHDPVTERNSATGKHAVEPNGTTPPALLIRRFQVRFLAGACGRPASGPSNALAPEPPRQRSACQRVIGDGAAHVVGGGVLAEPELGVERVEREHVAMRRITHGRTRAAPAAVAKAVLGRDGAARRTALGDTVLRRGDREQRPVHEAIGVRILDEQRELLRLIGDARPRERRRPPRA
jgi:integrase